jgi:hypothetical protein
MPQVRISEPAHEAGLNAPMAASTLMERFSLLILRGVGRDEECRKAYMLGVIDLLDAVRHASDGDPAYAMMEQVEAEAERLQRSYR